MAGFWDFLKSSVSNAWFSPRVTYVGGAGGGGLGDVAGVMSDWTAAEMWRTQPHLRTVVSFRARNVAQLGLHVFERVSDTDRKRDHASALAKALRRPDLMMTTYDLVFSLVGDLDLYDRAYWLIGTDDDGVTPLLRRLPPSWVDPVYEDPFTVKSYRVTRGDKTFDVPAVQVLAFSGYSPTSPVGASPAVEVLKDTLQEQIDAANYRGQVWKRGGRASAVLERPVGAPRWSDGAREAFREDWYAKYAGRGSHAGGTPILEDGMSLKRIDFNAQEQQFVEGAKLALTTVASVFHVNPTMVGLLDNANYSNVREFRRSLYGDTLGPLLAQIEARINAFLIPLLGMDPDKFYVEFNLQEKLQGSFEEQAQVMQTMVGAPIMTRNEGRAKFNLPKVDGGDEVVTPLNVITGGQASPTDSGSQNRTGQASRGAVAVKEPERTYEEQLRETYSQFFKRQGSAVRSRLGQKDDAAWWDGDRWDEELSDDLYKLALLITSKVGGDTLDGIGVSPDRYNVEQTQKFLRAVSDRVAGQVNFTTREAITDALGDDDPSAAVANVFDVAAGSRSEQAATTSMTMFAGFAAVEAAKQTRGSSARKRWQVNSGNPRASHAAMSGEEVPIEDLFSNGMMWPAAFDGDVAEVAGCQCSIVVVTD